MTVAEAIRDAAQRLGATSGAARLDAELLMAHALGTSRSDMLLRAMRDVGPEEFAALVARRAAHEPVAYITGWTEFYGRRFDVEPGVLIPRGDSEVLIDTALDLCPAPERLLDLGTGSGALLVTMLLECAGATGIGLDASSTAVSVAAANAQALGLIGAKARFVERDWRRPAWSHDLGKFDLILCNPPYVEEDAPLDPDVRDFEPAEALFAGKDGLEDYRILIPQMGSLLADGGIAVFEIGHAQAEAVSEIARNHGFTVDLRKDLANRPRCVVLR